MKPKQITLMKKIFSCNSLKEACEQSGVPYGTARGWMKNDEEFKQELNKQKSNLLEEVTINMEMGFTKAVEELMKIINGHVSPQVKVNAIDCLFRNAKPLIEQIDIIHRLEQIEESIKGDEDE